MLKKFLFFLIFSIFLVCPLSADELADVMGKLHKKYDNVISFQGDFKQISFFKAVNQLQEFEGKLFIKKPDKMKWDYTSPDPQVITSNGKKIWYYFPGDNQVNVGDLAEDNKEKNLIFVLLEGIDKVEKEFNVTIISGNDNQNLYYLQLDPKKPTTQFEKVILSITKNDFSIIQTHVFYLNGDVTKLIFKKSLFNQISSDDLFNFKPPAGAEVFQIPSPEKINR